MSVVGWPTVSDKGNLYRALGKRGEICTRVPGTPLKFPLTQFDEVCQAGWPRLMKWVAGGRERMGRERGLGFRV
jgi:hypothetical protein